MNAQTQPRVEAAVPHAGDGIVHFGCLDHDLAFCGRRRNNPWSPFPMRVTCETCIRVRYSGGGCIECAQPRPNPMFRPFRWCARLIAAGFTGFVDFSMNEQQGRWK